MTSVLQFDTAEHLGLFADREQWLEVRKGGIGGSEVAAICGLSKWESAYTLWLRKTGRQEDKDLSANEAVEWGQQARTRRHRQVRGHASRTHSVS